ncbi:hypothetical protein A3C96_04275 [Candidatus Uhrbacteria bacterium RIFCSPHIGHO2_02_FULL_60_10]|uniref:Hydrogenase maturation protease n=1 Tax=Candidatus Uhrbacteria bacterium RIFCSPHIGHO2_02_FULL_60_10 TaxID=1802392 RepID=A0A1F7U8P0_9BACT|nr:MAG: hypothetical protein A3C96_04275 [Candidatus Uhrbacteria bacterium RIFCSPHIGHO2_02_FULL_60_10]
MPILLFGNPEVAADSLPPRLQSALAAARPDLEFLTADPTENLPFDEDTVIVDTVINLEEPRLFTSLDDFAAAPRLTGHDYDVYAEMRWRQKLGKLKKVSIIGLPPNISPDAAKNAVLEMLSDIL